MPVAPPPGAPFCLGSVILLSLNVNELHPIAEWFGFHFSVVAASNRALMWSTLSSGAKGSLAYLGLGMLGPETCR